MPIKALDDVKYDPDDDVLADEFESLGYCEPRNSDSHDPYDEFD